MSAAAPDQGAADRSRVGAMAGSRRWLFRPDQAGEILPVPAISPVPHAKAWFAGLANVRGNLVCVVNFAQFLGLAPSGTASDARLLLVSNRLGAHSALLVDKVLGLTDTGKLIPTSARPDQPWIAARLADDAGERWDDVNVAALVGSDAFLQAGE
jgi:twitching motility protein PilI